MRPIQLFILLSTFFTLSSYEGSFSKHLKKFEHTAAPNQIKNIDYIYLINLDQRPEKYTNSLEQLFPYGILPQRFSAINGWNLSKADIEDVGYKFIPGMVFFLRNNGVAQLSPPDKHVTPLDHTCYGKTCFTRDMKPGAIGCTLSHLSVLQDAYDAGYETIWILEDDFILNRNPRCLSDLIVQLDIAVGKGNWDVLYTDADFYFKNVSEVQTHLWRPDRPAFDHNSLCNWYPVGNDFLKIGGRAKTHSMIVRRSGMKKILDFEMNHGIFLPYDHELGFVPFLNLYALKKKIVSINENSISDTERNNL